MRDPANTGIPRDLNSNSRQYRDRAWGAGLEALRSALPRRTNMYYLFSAQKLLFWAVSETMNHTRCSYAKQPSEGNDHKTERTKIGYNQHNQILPTRRICDDHRIIGYRPNIPRIERRKLLDKQLAPPRVNHARPFAASPVSMHYDSLTSVCAGPLMTWWAGLAGREAERSASYTHHLRSML
ncbi:hypothetical protein EVAR_9186_1 [Eumeta japonica]|uniref:Uncharacterized protein n=1 Tax=Eumeta variegata TaxID=151549 RepID=A0A4C1WQ95_EUMVA|nr:hypothetical protein EVAR_9186_1 [Eumeta japonica]